MAHIADLMVHHTAAVMNPFDAFIYGESPSNIHEDRCNTADDGQMRVKEKPEFVWRMQQPNQGRKYNLFPSKSHEKLLITGSIAKKKDNFGREIAAAMAAIGVASKEKAPQSKAAQSPKEQKLERRRKPSATDLGLMAAIQEASMDSPTIPGRYPVHERSISAPGHPSWRQSDYTAFSQTRPPVENYQCPSSRPQLKRSKSSSPNNVKMHSPQRPARPLAPLIIPSNPDMFPKRTLNRLSEQSVTSDTPPEVPPKSARMRPVLSPQSASTAPLTSAAPKMTPFTPYTPFSAPLSVPTMSFILPQDEAALLSPAIAIAQDQPAPLLGTKTPELLSRSPSENRHPSPAHSRGQSESSAMLLNVSKRGHKRCGSETSAIKQRGRAKQRPPPLPGSNPEDSFETLPVGFPATEAPLHMTLDELRALGKQALGQAVQFEVLSPTHVKRLSKELRSLDERCEYLRTTHRSLRSGRLNLHSRICDYLRSPRTAKFSFDSLIRQEEALAELDASIDEWFSKLELAENRRMRIRQKLLEHVAAALLLPVEPVAASSPTRTQSEAGPSPVFRQDEAKRDPKLLESATSERGPAWLEPATPCTIKSVHPSSPAERAELLAPAPLVSRPLSNSTALSSHPVTITLNSSSPQPSPLPGSWLSPTHEIIKCYQRDRDSYASTIGRPSAESIRIYAGEEVYRLLADVEEEIERMSFLPDGVRQKWKRRENKEERVEGNQEVEDVEKEEMDMELLKPVRFENVRRPSPLRSGGGKKEMAV